MVMMEKEDLPNELIQRILYFTKTVHCYFTNIMFVIPRFQSCCEYIHKFKCAHCTNCISVAGVLFDQKEDFFVYPYTCDDCLKEEHLKMIEYYKTRHEDVYDECRRLTQKCVDLQNQLL